MSASVKLGPFDLGERIGEGGMGAIYRGVHRGTGVPVAVKVIRRRADREARRRFHEEVQAHAGLQHPGVVYLFEYGEVGRETADGDRFREGDPFVVMELADRGTVRDILPPAKWQTIRRILLQVLDALAYAHARGVVHRDLKPENLLLFDEPDESSSDWGVKLADFGIAHAFDRERRAETEDLESVAGTPAYMAPEQIRGEWRAYGPWTDLYALGCIAWELASGRPPFDAENPLQVTISHEREPRPPLEPGHPMPDGLESWIHRAMAVEPERRFRRAADAAWMLPRPGLAEGSIDADSTPCADTEEGMATGATVELPSERKATKRLNSVVTATVPETVPPTEDEKPAEVTSKGERTETGDGRPVPDAIVPPVPRDWRPRETDALPAPLVGAGLGLFGLREPPFVNREAECDRIWESLRTVVEGGSGRVVFISGETGTGKSRLAEWMATRAHEVGAVRVLRATHTRAGGPHEGLRGALERALRCARMPRGEVFEHLRERLRPLEEGEGNWLERDARALTEYLRPTDDETEDVDGPAYRFSSAEQKLAAVARIFERLGRTRPVLLWLDDLQWGSEALGFLEHLAESGSPDFKLLVLATLRSDLVAERPGLRERLGSLETRKVAESLRIAPLAREHQRELLVDLLPLEDALADRLAARTEGHPLFAMQLLGHWIEEGAIEVGPDGFRVASERELELPEDIHGLWQRRLRRAVGDLRVDSPDAARRALERAAALGREVAAVEWDELSEDLGIERPGAVRDGLVERGLAERTEHGWAFAHGLLVESLERQANEAGVWERHHRRCANMLEQLYSEDRERAAVRIADHRIEAGDLEGAIEPLLTEAQRLRKAAQNRRARDVLARRRRLLDALDVPEDDARSIETDIELARSHMFLGEPNDSVLESTEHIRERAERAGDPRLLARTWLVQAMCRRQMGDFSEAKSAAQNATREARENDDESELCYALIVRGMLEFHSGNFEEASRHFDDARELAVEIGNRYRQLTVRARQAFIAVSRGDDDRASEVFEGVRSECRDAGFRNIELWCESGLGEIARFAGDARKARTHYRRSGRLAEELHLPGTVATSHLNLAGVELMAGRFEVAARQLRKGEARFEEIDRGEEQFVDLNLLRIAIAAGTGAWAEFDEGIEVFDDGWPEQARLLKDHPWVLEMAGDYAAEAGDRERAERVWRLAWELWDRLGDEEAAERVGEKIGG